MQISIATCSTMDTNTKQHNTKSNWRSKSNHHSSCNITHKQLRLSASNSQKNKKKQLHQFTSYFIIFYITTLYQYHGLGSSIKDICTKWKEQQGRNNSIQRDTLSAHGNVHNIASAPADLKNSVFLLKEWQKRFPPNFMQIFLDNPYTMYKMHIIFWPQQLTLM